MRIDLSTLLILGIAGYLVYQWQRRDLPTSTELGRSAYWNSSLGGLTEKFMGLYDPIWESWYEAAAVQEVEKRLTYTGPEHGIEQNYDWQGINQ